MASNNEDYLDELLRSVIDEDAPDIIDKPMLNEEELGREVLCWLLILTQRWTKILRKIQKKL